MPSHWSFPDLGISVKIALGLVIPGKKAKSALGKLALFVWVVGTKRALAPLMEAEPMVLK